MTPQKNIVWLASYPKSGNTWVRIFLANYFANEDKPLSINDAGRFGFGDSAASMYRQVAGGPIDPNNKRQILALRPHLLKAIASNGASVNFIKTHNVDSQVFGVDLIPPQPTRTAIYIVRNPLDVTLSFARHFAMSHDAAVETMGRSNYVTESNAKQVTEYRASWSDHVTSWTQEKRFPVVLLRYEDMLQDPVKAFEGMLTRAALPVDRARIEKAVRFSSFEEVSKQEKEGGFKETSEVADQFFTFGTSGQWQTELAPELVEKVRKQHRKMMKKHGYLE
ncbi:sulfotransferase domain-containing protein [Roseovarius indicus]|uniref:sulfotransferase domain-containing protein n=1 Tax=Roseovarius indicus TaxID=540747 RepID=UPI0032F0798A